MLGELPVVEPVASASARREPKLNSAKALRFALLYLQLTLVLLVVQQFQLESRTFFHVMVLGVSGFAINSLLPLPYRLPFFVAVSIASIFVAFGMRDGAFLILLALIPISVCHLPVSFGLRTVLLLAIGGAFAFWRAEIFHGPWPTAIWPILGSMLMFRLALYLYALKHDRKKPTVASTLAYFFMIPNVCFPLFPVVDYSTFRRTYYDAEPEQIYTTGVRWIVRGLIHLILYRVVYVHLVGDPMEVQTLGQLVQFLLATFLLYLRVSGQFHLIVGFLHLFGFRLPETHHLYYLASSFSDFWRRINIYWKDFMMRLVYYPSFFQLKRFGPTAALVGATIIVFVATWVLHSYQWFWLRGGFPLTVQDGLFWGFLGVLVVFGALKELKAVRKRKLGKSSRWSLSLGLKTAAAFTAICVLWSLWSAESMSIWFLMWGAAAKTSWPEVLAILALVAGGVAIAGRDWSTGDTKLSGGQFPYLSYHLVSTASLLIVLALSSRAIYEKTSPKLASLVASVQHSTLNARDLEQQHKGYYEKLDNSSRMSTQLWEISAQKPSHWIPLSATSAYSRRSDFLGAELKPNMRITFMDRPFTTNSWGMRDRERSLVKPPQVYRIAVLGPSHVMGSGVGDTETFPRLLEDSLNASTAGVTRFEVLNFGVSAFALTQQLAMLNDRALRFHPDAVFVTDSEEGEGVVVSHLLDASAKNTLIPFSRVREVTQQAGVSAMANQGVPVLFDFSRSLLAAAGVPSRMPWAEGELRLRRARERAVQATFEEIAELSRKNGAVPVFVALNTVEPRISPDCAAERQAAKAGLMVFDLLNLWSNHDMAALRVHLSDTHANAAGNRLIAERLRDLIRTKASELRIEPGSPTTSRSVRPQPPSPAPGE